MTSRRTFVGWLSGLGAALGIGVRARPAGAEIDLAEQGAGLSTAMVRSLAEAELPGELGDDGFARVSRGFTQWVAGYRPGVELVHPYGSAEIRQTGASPAARWRAQLAALDREARQKHRRAFSALTRVQRRELVAAALSAERTNRMPDPLDANHVGMALIAWYFATPDAVDLCYNARIGRNQCRPLVNAPRQPLPLREAGGRMKDGRQP
jgi:hypothetical protein